MKFALIGNGNIAPQYLEAFRQYTDDVVICSRTLKESRFPQTTDYTAPEILETDIVCIATPPYLHFNMAKYYLDRGKQVVLEKPAVTSRQELEELLTHPQRHNLYFAYHSAFNPLVQHVASVFKPMNFHEVEVSYTEDVFFYHPDRDGWLFKSTLSGGGCLADSGINIFSILYRFLPDIDFKSGVLSQKEMDVEDNLKLLLQSRSGTEIQVAMDWLSNREERKFVLRGNSEVIFDLASGQISVKGENVSEHEDCVDKVDQYSEYKNMIADALQYFETGVSNLNYNPSLPLETVFQTYERAEHIDNRLNSQESTASEGIYLPACVQGTDQETVPGFIDK